jgi:hypothetical protein
VHVLFQLKLDIYFAVPKFTLVLLFQAYAGFSSPSSGPSSSSSIPVASGKWGCGAFGGDPTLKAILQWLACSAAGRPLAFFTFGDAPLHKNLLELNALLHTKTIRELTEMELEKIPQIEFGLFLFVRRRNLDTIGPIQLTFLLYHRPNGPKTVALRVPRKVRKPWQR